MKTMNLGPKVLVDGGEVGRGLVMAIVTACMLALTACGGGNASTGSAAGDATPAAVATPAGAAAEVAAADAPATAAEFATAEAPATLSAPTPVHTATAQVADRAPRLLSSGTVSSRAEMDLSFNVPGYVEVVHVREGQRVRAGQVLATLQTTEVDAQYRAAKAQADLAAQNLARMERLVRDSIMAPVRLDEARDASERAQAGLAIAEFNRTHASVRAPSSGRIIRRYVEASEFAGPGTPVLRFGSDAGGWVVVLYVADHQVVNLRVGSRATVRFTSLAATGPVEGSVTEIADGADPGTGTFRVEVEMSPSVDLPLRSGMVARDGDRVGR